MAVALSVDGLNTIDARHTSASDAQKWVLDPHEVVTISGWQTNRTQARRFEFTTEERSYAQALGRSDNLGMISAAFFKERVTTITRAPAAPSAPAAESAARDRSAPSARAARPDDPSTTSGSSRAQPRGQEYAATGMGRETDHAVTQVWLDLEDTPAQTIDIRYEYRAQLGDLESCRRRASMMRCSDASGLEASRKDSVLSHRSSSR